MERIFKAFLPVFSLLFIWQATQLPAGNTLIGARTFPLLIGGIMLVVSVILAWQGFRPSIPAADAASLPLEDEGGDGEGAPIQDWPAVWAVLAGVFLLTLMLRPLGFVAAIALCLFGLSTFFNPKLWIVNLIVAVTFSLVSYLLFTRVLGIPLPNGVLRPLF